MIIACTAHRPNRLGGANEQNPLAVAVKCWLRWQVERVLAATTIETAVSGGALGGDTWFAETVQQLGIHHTLAIPFEGYDVRWSKKQRNRGAVIRSRAQEVVVVHQTPPSGRYGILNAYCDRNEYMVNRTCAHESGEAGILFGVCGDAISGTWQTLSYALRLKNRPRICYASPASILAWHQRGPRGHVAFKIEVPITLETREGICEPVEEQARG